MKRRTAFPETVAASSASPARVHPWSAKRQRGRGVALALLFGLAATSGTAQTPAGPAPAASAVGRSDTASPPAVQAFVDVAVVPMDRERVLAHQTVLVRGDRIVTLGPASQIAVPAGATRIDGRGKYLLPGLADMHVHLGFTTSDTAASLISNVLFAYVANGVTTVRDMHSGGRSGIRNGSDLPDTWRFMLRRRVATGELLGPRIYTAGDPDLSSPAAAARSVAELEADGHDFVKISLDDERWPATKPLYDSLIAAAHRVGLRVVGHVPQGLELSQVLADHWASTEHLYEYPEYVLGLAGRWSLAVNGSVFGQPQAVVDTAVWMRPSYRLDPAKLHELAEAIRRAGVWNCPTVYLMKNVLSQVRQAGQSAPPGVHVAGRIAEFNLQIIKALQDVGAGLLLGTDVGGGWRGEPPGFAVHRELATLVEAGLTPYQALATATRNVAEFLGALDSSGTVAVGKRADLVLLNDNPLRNISATIGPAGVMVQGHWLARADLDRRFAEMATRP